MATRYEKIAAYSTLKGLDRVLETIWLVSHWLTDWEPRTGQDLVIRVCDTNELVRPDGSQLKEFADSGIESAVINISALQAVVADVNFSALLDIGLLDFTETLFKVQEDTNSLVTIKNQYAVSVSTDKAQLAALGNAILEYTFEVEKPPAPLTEAERIVVIIHDLLDAAMYNLRCLNSENGATWDDNSVENIKKHLYQRCRTLGDLRMKAYALADIAEVDQIYAIVDYIQAEYLEINNRKQASDLATYIETSIPRLPLLRRYWSL